MCCADPDAAPWEAAAPRTAETARPLNNNHVSAPLRALIEQGLLADRFEDRLAPEQAYLRALDLQMCGGEGAQRAREAVEKQQASSSSSSSVPQWRLERDANKKNKGKRKRGHAGGA